MLNDVTFYYYSPTGGTKKTGNLFCLEAAKKTEIINLTPMSGRVKKSESDAPAVIAVPVFGGRVPETAARQLRTVEGRGRTAVTIVVYGNRAYEDALLELNDIAEECGFRVTASGAFIAQHSMVPEVGAGRPDDADAEQIREFARRAVQKIESGDAQPPEVPGNRPYKEGMNMQISPVCTSSCTLCETCEDVCPENAILIRQGAVSTDPALCTLCMACVAACPVKARILPQPLQERTEKMLSPFRQMRRENETFL